MKSGIIIIAELREPLRQRILDIQRKWDPKLARAASPHLTITGSSGMGPIATGTPIAELRAALEPIARETKPMKLKLLKPMRFMQTNVVVLPLDPNGPIRALHERIKRSGLQFEQERFTFTPHVTLSFFRELNAVAIEQLLAVRIDDPVVVDHFSVHRTVSITDSKQLLDFPLKGAK
jgi:2'-5' RNA ligase